MMTTQREEHCIGSRKINVCKRNFPESGSMIKMTFWGLILAGVLSFSLVCQGMALASSPAIQLFPTSVIENIKQTGDTAKSMEMEIQDTINALERQMQVYTDSKCMGENMDEGCGAIAKQLGQTYKEMLTIMEKNLPSMEQSVTMTRDSLKSRISSEMGRKMTPRQLQKMLQGTKKEKRTNQRRSNNKASLSHRFRQYYDLISTNSARNGRGSVAVVASELYLDTEEVLNLIALTRDEIGREKLIIDVNNNYGSVTPEMVSMVAGVKSILFGEDEGGAMITDAPVDQESEAYRSPLEY